MSAVPNQTSRLLNRLHDKHTTVETRFNRQPSKYSDNASSVIHNAYE